MLEIKVMFVSIPYIRRFVFEEDSNDER